MVVPLIRINYVVRYNGNLVCSITNMCVSMGYWVTGIFLIHRKVFYSRSSHDLSTKIAYAPTSKYSFTLSLYRSLQWRHNERNGVSNHQPHDCLLNCLFGRRSKKTSKLCVTGLCTGNSPVTGEFPAQRASNAEKVSIWWRHHGERNYIEGFVHDCSNSSSYSR